MTNDRLRAVRVTALTAVLLAAAAAPGLARTPADAPAPPPCDVTSADDAGRLEPTTTAVRIVKGAADATAVAVARLTKLERVDARASGITDAGLRALAAAKSLVHLDASECPAVTDAGVRELAALKKLETLRIAGAEKVGDGALAVIGKLERLRILDLSGCRAISDAGLEGIRELPKIEELDLSGVELTEKGTKHIARLRTLKVLRLSRTAIPDVSMQDIVALGDLETLDVSDNSSRGFGEIGLLHVNGLRKLRCLDVSKNATVTDDVLRNVAATPALEELRATDCANVTDAGVAMLVKSKTLRDVDFSGTNVSVKGLAVLAPLKTLTRLRVAGCARLAADDLARVRAALPKCTVVAE